tara:strand:- start:13231 stop:14580 length:1350 start_codon:yes stop_codon:yes gene_type:complete
MSFILPNIGEGIDNISVSEILVEENQKIKANDSVLLVETDKASMEIPIDKDCIIEKILVREGDTISPGQKILEIKNIDIKNDLVYQEKNVLQKDESKSLDSKENTPPSNFENQSKNEITDKIDTESTSNLSDDDSISQKSIRLENVIPSQTKRETSDSINASPSVRKFARELNCNIKNISGSGPNNRITKEDVLNYTNGNNSIVKDTPKKSLTDQFLSLGPIKKVSLNNVQSTSATRLHKSWTSIPHVTQFDEVKIDDLSDLIKLLKRINKNPKSKVSYIPFFIKAVYLILKQLEIFNSSLDHDGNTVIKKYYYNIGFAVDTPRGLFVPVIKNVDKKSIKQITIEFNNLINKAMDNKLTIDDMTGGCITISSLGNISGKFFTPIINSPEVAILGVSKIFKQIVERNGKLRSQSMLPISLSYDHRVINGADAAKFTKLFGEIINKTSLLK